MDITAHPLWEKQVELERGMLREGADRFRDRVVEASERSEATRLAPVRGLVTDWLPRVAKGLREWVNACGRSRGPKPIALAYLKDVDPYVVSLIAVRGVLDGIAAERVGATGVAVAIGQSVEHEMQVREWEAKEPALFYAQQKRLSASGATDVHRRRVNINRFNSLLATGHFSFGWEPWSQEVHFRVGVALLETIIRVTSWFELRDDPQHVYTSHSKRPKLVLVAKPGLLAWLGKQLDAQEVMFPAYMPTVVPPKRWEGTRSGGYWMPYVRTPRLIRFKANQIEQREKAADEYEALDMPQVYDAIHRLQEVPWRINRRVYEVAEAVVARDLGIAGVPQSREIELPPKPANFDNDEDAKRTWKRAASKTYGRNAKRLAILNATGRTLRIAKTYREFECFYFPHMLDFRGRMYPIPVNLQPQGDDFARGLLEFAEGKAVTTDNQGDAWIAVHLASMWGNDKVSFDERIAWVHEREDMWRRIVADPLASLEWADCDKPWQALAALYDWVAFLDHGFGYVSHLAVAVDGTCNGIQHLSAMTRDAVAGEHVNLTPSDKPKDIYKFVASKLQAVLTRIRKQRGEPGQHAKYWLTLCKNDIPRTLTKRQVMVLPYGGTRDSFFAYTRAWLDEHDPLPAEASEDHIILRMQRIGFLVTHMWDAVSEVVHGGMIVMEWLRTCAKAASVGNQPIFWVTPCGFVVRHFYGRQLERRVHVLLDGTRFDLTLHATSKDLDIKSQLLGIPPNFVHSQDAAALTICINRAFEAGVTAFTAVHDMFGTHAADMWGLSRHLRAAFIAVHSIDVLAGFRNACMSVMVAEMVARLGIDPDTAAERADEKLPKLPDKGGLDLTAVMESDYFFA